MKAMVLRQPKPIEELPLELAELPEPQPGEGELLVRVEACGVCRTDLHVVEGDLPPVRDSVVPGHQVVGTVAQLGLGARRFRVGDRVGIAWLRWTCGTCRYCSTGQENLCPNARFTGYHADGGYAEYTVVPEEFAHPIPPELGAAEATPLLCAGIIGYRALRRAETRPGCRLGMYGFGSSAHIAIQVARHWGCEVYVMTRESKHRELALALGAVWVGDSQDKPPVPLDSAILFAPVGHLVHPALEALDRGGTLAIAGIYLTDIPPLNYERHVFYEKNLRSVTANTRADAEELLALAAAIPIRARVRVFPLHEANEVLRRLKFDGLEGTGVLVMA
ncbi:MAG: zinc-dependent alcohol dehydrogenase family protein [Candidatus Binatia bacterium]|nr:zinc-dependent alcohol dehydrogenase family protein [Candidatus Binatia bacterium]